ncbi:MAG: HEAT repeat domain-containing protein [Planctomycetaceae bacterium]
MTISRNMCRRRILLPTVGFAFALLLNLGIVSNRAVAIDQFDPRTQASIEKACEFLYANMLTGIDGRDSIAAYALMKAGESEETPEIAEVIKRINARIPGGTYSPKLAEQRFQVYVASADLLTLAEADPEKYQPEIQSILRYIYSQHASHGGYSYPPGSEYTDNNVGDTSITQYAALAMWGATQAGVDVNPEEFDRIAGWCISTQLPDGSFTYHPGREKNPMHSMTVGGLQTLLIARLHLYPNAYAMKVPDAPVADASKEKEAEDPAKAVANKFKVLEKVNLEEEAALEASKTRKSKRHTKAKSPKAHDYKSRTSLEQINASIEAAEKWLDAQFTVTNPTGWKWYYLYGLERYAALTGRDAIGGHDWYGEGIVEVVNRQQEDGSWGVTNNASSKLAETAFCILFLTKATARIFKPIKNSVMVGTGLLVGGRGLPDKLDQLEMKNGKAAVKKNLGDIDELLKALENPQLTDVESTQADLVETVQLGDRSQLIHQKDRLLKLVEHPDSEVRRTALWALGRTGDIRMATPIIHALDTNDLDVLVEANNALCWLSRRPRGMGLPDSPYDELDEDATDEEKQVAFEAWKKQAQELWKEWYQKVRPYDERDDLNVPFLRSRQKSRS